MNKRTLDAIARRWDFKTPAIWTQKQAERLCDQACDEYATSDGVWEPLLAEERAQREEIKRTTKELERVVDARCSLQRVRKPTQATQRLLDAARTTERNLADEVQMLTNSLVFDGLPKNKSKKGRGRPKGYRKSGDGGPMLAKLELDLATVQRLAVGATTRKAQARAVHALLEQHGIPITSVEAVEQRLRDAR